MAAAFVDGKAAGSGAGSNVTTASVDSTGATLAIIAAGYYQAASVLPTISDSKSNTPYVGLTTYEIAANNRNRIYYFASPSVGASHTGTLTSGGGAIPPFPSIGFAVFSGVLGASPFDQENGGTGTAVSSKAVGSVTPGFDGEVCFTTISFDGAITGLSIDSGFTIIDALVGYGTGTHYGFACAYLVQGAAAAVNPTWSWTTARSVAVNIATFKAAASTSGLRRNSALAGMGASGPFFQDPLALTPAAGYARHASGLHVPERLAA